MKKISMMLLTTLILNLISSVAIAIDTSDISEENLNVEILANSSVVEAEELIVEENVNTEVDSTIQTDSTMREEINGITQTDEELIVDQTLENHSGYSSRLNGGSEISNLDGYFITKWIKGTANSTNPQFPTTFSKYFNSLSVRWESGNTIGPKVGDKISAVYTVPRQYVYSPKGINKGDSVVVGTIINGQTNLNKYTFTPTSFSYDSGSFRVTFEEVSSYVMKEPVISSSSDSEGQLADYSDMRVTIERIKDATHTTDRNNQFNVNLNWNFNPYFYYHSWPTKMWYRNYTHTLNNAFKVSFNEKRKEDEKLTATATSQKMILGQNLVATKDLVTNVKLGDQTVSNSNYKVELLNDFHAYRVGNDGKAKVKVSLISDTSKSVEVDIPVTVSWGHSLVKEGNNSNNNTDKILALTLHNATTPFITATIGRGDDTQPIHSDFTNDYYQVDWFDLDGTSTKLMDDTDRGTESITANGQDIIKYKINQWGNTQNSQTVNYGDVVRTWHAEDKSWIYDNQENNTNTLNGYNYFEITNSGYNLLYVNKLKTIKQSVPYQSMRSELDKIVDTFIDLDGQNNIKVIGFIDYPKTNIEGEQPATIRVEETTTNNKKIQYDYPVIVEIEEAQLIVDVPRTIDFGSVTFDKLGRLYWPDNQTINILNQGYKPWELTAKLTNTTSDFSSYLKLGSQSFNNGTVHVYSSKGEESYMELTEKFTKDQFIYVDYSKANKLRKDSGVIEWVITPSTRGVSE